MNDASTPKKPRITRPGAGDDVPTKPRITRPGAAPANDVVEDVVEVEIPIELPDLLLHKGNLPAAVYELRDLLAAGGTLFDRGSILAEIKTDAAGTLFTHEQRVSGIVMKAHTVCQPMQLTKKGGWEATTLTDRVAKMYLEMGEWQVQPLAGITTAPLLRADGTIITTRGYDEVSQMFCDHVPVVAVPAHPSKTEAEAALGKLRATFRTFPFADSLMIPRDDGIEIVDLDQPPSFAESAYLNALLTAVARPSLWLAPGLLINAPQLSGSGSGKGLLARAITIIAYGVRPKAFPAGDKAEFEKRIGAALMTGRPVALVDNINGRMLRSETLDSVITERPAECRVLGYSRMLTLNAACMIILTGNGLSASEDLTRRFLFGNIDPQMENPETRPLKAGFLDDIESRRGELLTAALTILRFGRQHANELKRGKPFGSFETWAEWVRDPLLTLGCADPVEETMRAKQRDPKRQALGEIFTKWYERHGSEWVTADDLDDDVKHLIDPDNRGRQYIAPRVEEYVNTRVVGYALTRRKNPVHHWVAARYQLTKTDGAAPESDPEAPPKSPYWAHREAEAARWREQWRDGQLADDDDDPR